MKDSNPALAIAVFAYNESARITACLESIRVSIINSPCNALPEDSFQCFVLANGCSDNTAQVVAEYQKQYSWVNLVDIKEGDKSNAWNVFVHDVAAEAETYIFMDGDCEVVGDSLYQLYQYQKMHPNKNALAAIPMDIGRGTKQQIITMVTRGGLAGNLYALPHQFIKRVRTENIKLPIGTIGEDSLVGALACFDLDVTKGWDRTRIGVCEQARFTYEPMGWLSWREWKVYYRRKQRYSIRHWQNKMIKAILTTKGPHYLPGDVKDMYQHYLQEIKLSWRGLDTYFDMLAWRQINKDTEQVK
ncbi:glycosyltransferase [Zooshikella ganghwensis]|uniref:glycosyltransferase n=1 Tax=Zooshikella ganghwensis TaxID=202772 RepID=UPI00041D2328|nr:glycosyltransferase family A protein [Zooshikella ganghwensis]